MKDNIRTDAAGVFEELDFDDGFKDGLDLFETVKRNNNFYHDRQWEGVRAPDLDKPVFNIIKPAINYYVSMLVSDDIGVEVNLTDGIDTLDSSALEEVIQTSVEQVMENIKFGWMSRKFLKNCAIDGDGCMYLWWDTSASGGGALRAELVDNTDVCFGDKSTNLIEDQPYMIIRQRKPTLMVRQEAQELGVEDWESIWPDGMTSGRLYNDEKLEGDFTTVAIKFWKQDGRVWWLRTTRDVMLQGPVCMEIERYPLVYMSWEAEKNNCHGISPITGRINNQIFINKIYAMAMEYQKNMAFPKLLYDATMVPKWSNKVGQAIAVHGNPQQAVFASFAPAGMNEQAISLASNTISLTQDSMGVYDASLGNVAPENTSAIIAVQRASAQPLELQRLDFYQTVEDFVRVVIEFLGHFYGLRQVMLRGENKTKEYVWFDFNVLADLQMQLKVNIGAASYWSELAQIHTLDNMLASGIIPDALTYLEQIPDGYVRNKAKIMSAIRDLAAQQDFQQQLLQQSLPGQDDAAQEDLQQQLLQQSLPGQDDAAQEDLQQQLLQQSLSEQDNRE